MIDYSKIDVNDFDSFDKNGEERKINKNFLSKMMYAPYEVKEIYNELKNIFVKYGFKDKFTQRFETFKKGDLIFKFSINRTNFKLHASIDEKYLLEHQKYHIKKLDSKALAKTPYYFRLKSSRAKKYAKEAVLDLLKENNFKVSRNYTPKDYFSLLIPDGKVIMQKLGLKDYYLYDDVTLRNLPKDVKYDFLDYIPRYKQNLEEEKAYATFYVDTLCDNFDDYSIISVDTLKELNFMHSGNALRIKARGKMDKKLIIFADEFDDDALRMLIHTNSTAVLVE